MSWICFNGTFYPSGAPILPASNRSFKWGDGVFETIRVKNGNILLEALHFERLFFSMKLIHIVSAHLEQEILVKHILELCAANHCNTSARVRLAVCRDDEIGASFVIEAVSLDESETQWRKNGLQIDLYPYARKPMDALANLKTSSFLIYILAGQYARVHHLDDVIVLNTTGRVCDTSRANLFIIRKNEIFTPALREGCINGVMRRHVIGQLKILGYAVHQEEIKHDELIDADEIFLTNAIMGIRWVEQFQEKKYPGRQVFSLFQEMNATIVP